MPQMATFKIGAKIEKGPDVNSESKFEVGSYAAIIEEPVSKCCWSDPIELQLPPNIEMLVISADKYSAESDPSAGSNGATKRCDDKHIKYYFEKAANCTAGAGAGQAGSAGAGASGCPALDDKCNHVCLRFPHVFVGPTTCLIPLNATKLCVHNELTIDIKISVLIVRKKTPKAMPASAPPMQPPVAACST